MLMNVVWEPLSNSNSPRLLRRKGGGRGGGAGKSSSSSAGKAGSVPLKSSGSKPISASSGSRGGGTPTAIPSGSPFAGRLSGGGTRDTVYGTSRIGSGYPYGSYGSFYGGRPFPYVFEPVYILPGYYGGDEYDPNSSNATRPGGELSTAIVQPITVNSSFPESSFYVFGDAASVSVVLASLVSGCGIANATVAPAFKNDTGSTTVHPEQIVQYYRASSFALALSSYNNTAALPANAPASNTSSVPPIDDTPLPEGLDRMLLTCINGTIAKNIPLVDLEAKKGIPQDLIIVIVLSVPVLLVVCYVLLRFCLLYCGLFIGSCLEFRPRSRRSNKADTVPLRDGQDCSSSQAV